MFLLTRRPLPPAVLRLPKKLQTNVPYCSSTYGEIIIISCTQAEYYTQELVILG